MMTLEEIAKLVCGEIVGDRSIEIHGVETIEGARCGDLTFATDDKILEKLADTRASAAIISPGTAIEKTNAGLSYVLCDDPRKAFTKVARQLRPVLNRKPIGISEKAEISDTARLAENVCVYPGAFIGAGTIIGSGTTIYPGVCIMENCVIGENVSVFPNAVIYESTVIGDRVLIHANAVIGAFGFGYDSNEQGHQLSVQLGNVEVANDVEIGANTTIDRGTFGTTRIGEGSKLDNQVQIGHNCQIGSHNLLCSQVGIAGSSNTGDFVVMGGQVGIGDHLTIGDRAMVCAQSGIMHNLDPNQTYLGSPATPAREQFQVIASQGKLPEMRKQLKKLDRTVAKLETKMESITATAEAVSKDAA